jgi:hypothetical protein
MGPGIFLAAFLSFASAAECPLEVSRVCGQDCGTPASRCPLGRFSCDFKVCWDTRLRVAGEDLLRAIVDPANYSQGPGEDPWMGGINFISKVSLVDPRLPPGLYLDRGFFVLEVPSLTKGTVAAQYVASAQKCAKSLLLQRPDLAEASRRSPNRFLVAAAACDGTAQLKEEDRAAQARSLDVDGLPRDLSLASEEQLRSYLKRDAGETEFSDEDNVFQACGYRSFAADPDGWEESQYCLDRKQRAAYRLLHDLVRSRVLWEAQAEEPAPPGQAYAFDEKNGNAVLQSADNK